MGISEQPKSKIVVGISLDLPPLFSSQVGFGTPLIQATFLDLLIKDRELCLPFMEPCGNITT